VSDASAAGVEPPLAGVRVLDLTRLLPGPMCTLYLADLGADVVKVEDTGAGDYARTLALRARNAPDRATAWFNAINRNKRSVAVDLKSADGHAAFMALARNADVIIEGFRPGVVAALRADYETVRAVNPKVVYCALSGYGQTGPRASFAGHDINYLGYTGALDCTGERGGSPALANLQIADLLGGAASAAIGILAALYGATRSGRSRFIDIAMADAVLAHQIFLLGALEDDGTVAPRGEDLLTGGVPCYGVYPTRDGAGSPSAHSKRSSGMRCAQRSNDRISCPASSPRVSRADAVRETLAAIFGSATLADWCARFAAVDCCVTPVLTFDEALADAQFAARAMVIRRPDGSRQYAPPFKLAPPAFAVTRDAPEHGEHTRDVLREAGYADAAIDALVASGAVLAR
jgi:crotonobetainyl-CoA:carnitine CoA-transferase CaiB-like acyl-CoA transferase